MDLQNAIASTLLLLPLAQMSGCTTCGKVPREDFVLDEPLSAEELDALVDGDEMGPDAWAELECEDVCRTTYEAGATMYVSSVGECALTLPATEDEEGRVVCAGEAKAFCEGRRPVGHAEVPVEATDPLGWSLASLAALEEASVDAFEQLAQWLGERGAPAALVARCRAAAEDERRHARWLGALARRRGATIPPGAPLAERPPTLLEMAMHNAVEGCVHESYAALVASLRARQGGPLGRLFARIAADETRHGQLAWDLHAWFMERLPASEAALVEQAQHDALVGLPQRAVQAHDALAPEVSPLSRAGARESASIFAERLAAA